MKRAFLVFFVLVFACCAVFAGPNAQKDAVYRAIEKYQAGITLTDYEHQLMADAGFQFDQPVIDETGGPDGFGYIFKDSQEPDGPDYNFVDISATGTSIGAGMSDDGEVGPYPIGFTFSYYGADYTQFWVESNGCISFGGIFGISFVNTALPYVTGTPVIFWCWDDWYVPGGGSVYYETLTVEGQNALVLMYDNVAHYSGVGSGTATGEVILFQDGTIRTQYDEFVAPWPNDSQTIGIQNGDGTIYLQADYDLVIPNYPFAGLAIDFWVQPGDADLSGVIRDWATNNPLANATVQVWIWSTQTNANGQYSFTGVYSGDNTVTVSKTGYNTYSEIVTLDPGPNTWNHTLAGAYALDLTPGQGTSVPAGGGVFTYSASLANPTPFTVIVDAWTWAVMPNGTAYGPVQQVSLTLAPGNYNVPQLQQQVPGNAPSGLYSWNAAMGDFPNLILSQDIFWFWKLGPSADGSGGSWYGTPWDTRISSLSEPVGMPQQYEVGNVYPNPFNPTANLSVNLPETAELTVRVYNIAGQLVAELANGTFGAGQHNLVLDGSALSSGVYFVHTEVPGQLNSMQKVTLLK